MMKTFTKITATTAALLLTAGVTFAATIQSADASGTDTGPCITAVRVDDPTIKAQRGNCADVTTTVYSTLIRVQLSGGHLSNQPYNVQLFNSDTGARVAEVDGQFDVYGYALTGAVTDTSSVPPNYRLSVTYGGETYTTTYGPSDFTETDEGGFKMQAVAVHQNVGDGEIEYEFWNNFEWDEDEYMAGWN